VTAVDVMTVVGAEAGTAAVVVVAAAVVMMAADVEELGARQVWTESSVAVMADPVSQGMEVWRV
jgi:hypothetical protein